MAKSIMHLYQGDLNTVEPLIVLISIVVPVLGLAINSAASWQDLHPTPTYQKLL